MHCCNSENCTQLVESSFSKLTQVSIVFLIFDYNVGLTKTVLLFTFFDSWRHSVHCYLAKSSSVASYFHELVSSFSTLIMLECVFIHEK
jgi:hypothetical protein